jgi:hypothetical protein
VLSLSLSSVDDSRCRREHNLKGGERTLFIHLPKSIFLSPSLERQDDTAVFAKLHYQSDPKR